MSQATLAWVAFKNMMQAAARDPLWAFVALLSAPFRIWKPLLGLLFFLIIVLFVIGFGGRFVLEQMGFGVGSSPVIALDLVTLLVLAALAFRFITNPLILHFGDIADDTHGSARFATNREVAPLTRSGSGLLIGRDGKTGKLLRYDGPAHLITMAPTRTGKGVGAIIPNLLTADRSVICIDPKGENANIAGRARKSFGPVHILDPFGVTGLPSAAFNPLDGSRWLRLIVTQSLIDMARDPAKPQTPVLYLLDEFASLGHLAPVECAMGLMAGYGVQLWPILQDVHQLRATYGQKAGTFLSNAGLLQVFSVNDHDNAHLVSDLLGQETVVFQTMARALDSEKSGISYSHQHRQAPRRVQGSVRSGMNKEVESLSKTLAWAVDSIAQCGPDHRKHIALAYWQAQESVANIPKDDDGDARPRILACFERSDACRAANDMACVGWILTAIQERVNERNLPDWRKLRKVINKTLKMLPLSEPTVH